MDCCIMSTYIRQYLQNSVQIDRDKHFYLNAKCYEFILMVKVFDH